MGFAENDASIAFDASNNVRMDRDSGYVKPEWITQPYPTPTAVDHQDGTITSSTLSTKNISAISGTTLSTTWGYMYKGDLVFQGSAVGVVKEDSGWNFKFEIEII